MIESFSDVQGGNKGVDIAGSRGQPVLQLQQEEWFILEMHYVDMEIL